MMQEVDAGIEDTPEAFAIPSLAPNLALLAIGSSAAAAVSFVFLPWPLALASTVLALLMIAGADVDARTLLLPDIVTYGATLCGILAAPVPALMSAAADPWSSAGGAILRAAATALVLGLVRWAYAKSRGTEGFGFGDVKLAAAVGAWLPLEAIPYCFMLATLAALASAFVKTRGKAQADLKLPFGTFLCPALWLVFFVTALPG